jgi:drug/metabolite transporter (DMT)-like permease
VPLVLLGLPDLLGAEGRQASPVAFGAAALSGCLAIGLAYFFWNYAISHLGSAHTSFYSNLTPIVALLTAWLWLGETLTLTQGLGAALAISGVVLARRHSRPLG